VFAAILAGPDDVDLRLRYAAAVRGGDPEHAERTRLQVDGERDRLVHRPPDPAPHTVDILAGFAGRIGEWLAPVLKVRRDARAVSAGGRA